MSEIKKTPADAFRQALAAAIKENAEGAETCDCCVCSFTATLRTPALETLTNEVPKALKEGVPIEDVAAIAAGAFGQAVALTLNAVESDEDERREDAKKALGIFASELFRHAGLGEATLVDDAPPPGVTQH